MSLKELVRSVAEMGEAVPGITIAWTLYGIVTQWEKRHMKSCWSIFNTGFLWVIRENLIVLTLAQRVTLTETPVLKMAAVKHAGGNITLSNSVDLSE